MPEVKKISPKELAELVRHGKVDLIDVRTPREFREVHAVNARNVPLDSLDPQSLMKERNGTAHEPLYVICKSGARGCKACEKFERAGYEQVINVEGGTSAWVEAGLPVERGKKAMSLERQTRIVAGTLALIGSVAAIASGNAYFAIIPAFIGAGLSHAGITDSCAMGMMLSKMPWNR